MAAVLNPSSIRRPSEEQTRSPSDVGAAWIRPCECLYRFASCERDTVFNAAPAERDI